jgi:ribonuclease BN (tRNA processing enzyme)
MIASAISEMNCGRPGEHIKILEHLLQTNLVSAEICQFDYWNLIGSNKTKSEYWVKSFVMDHKIKSFGYIIYRRTKKLKAEYNGLNPTQIIELKKTIGEENLTTTVHTPLIGYTGDTTINGVIAHSEFLSVPLLIMECTGFSPDDDCTCCEGKHIHINDIIMHSHLFFNKKIVLFHFSQQYRDLKQILDYCSHIPEILKEKLIYFF